MVFNESSSSAKQRRAGITVVEVLVVTGLIGVLTALLLPAIQSSRESARMGQCQARLRGLTLASQAYESAHKAFPYTSTVFLDNIQGTLKSFDSESPHRHLMPYIDESIGQNIDYTDKSPPTTSEGFPAFAATNRDVMNLRISALLCPSDIGANGGTNYRACLGPSVHILNPKTAAKLGFPIEPTSQAGAFVAGRSVRVSEFTDGLSQTALFSERVVGDASADVYDAFRDLYSPVAGSLATNDDSIVTCRSNAIANPETTYSFMGHNWLMGGWLHSWYNHATTPNSTVPDCAGGGAGFIVDGGPGLYTARSLHPGGVYVAMADGAVLYVSDAIDLHVWRAMATRNGAEVP